MVFPLAGYHCLQKVLHWLGSGKRFPREDSNLTLHTPKFWMERDSPALVESKEVVENLKENILT